MLAQLFTGTAIGVVAISYWQANALIRLSTQDLPDPGLIKDIGLVGYLLLACVAALLVMGTYLVKKLVDALVDSLKQTSAAITEITTAEAGQRLMLEQISTMLIDTKAATQAQLAIAQEWQKDGARIRDLRRET